MLKKWVILCLVCFCFIFFYRVGISTAGVRKVSMAVEFVSHAACAHIAREKGWFKKEGLNVSTFDNYITGMALAGALSKGGIDAAYICAIPAIVAYANGGIRMKIVCGTHRYGYGLIVNQKKVRTVQDLMRDDVRIACPREGSPTDAVMHKMIDKYHLDAKKLLGKTLRMPPPMVLFAMKAGQIDAGFCCEQFPSMGVEAGFKELASARDLWPDMQGSVLVVTDDLIERRPEIVEKLVKVTEKATEFIHSHPDEASRITSEALTVVGKKVFPFKIADVLRGLTITPQAVKRALFKQMECTTDIDVKMVQQEIDYISHLGYIKRFDAHDILDLRWIHE